MNRPRRLVCTLCLLAAGCEDPALAADDLTLRVVATTTEIDFGRAFPLTVVRTWRKGLIPQEWSEKALSPLRLRLVAAARRENASHVEDSRRYDAFAFGRDALAIEVPPFRARAADGSERTVPGPVLHLRVRTSLAADAGPVELPGDLMPAPFGWRWTLAVAATATTALGFVAWRYRRRPPALAAEPAPKATAGDARARALQRLAALRARHATDAVDSEPYFVELAETLRNYVAGSFAVRTAEQTTAEMLALPPVAALDASVRAHAAAALTVCDLVKFARARPDAPLRAHALAAAEEFVTASARGDGA